ncbi:MAG TPA: hypothetical protein VKO87_00575, partial [Gemmatimonadaceae bacterium]|nr:hypothetical protein [Gemmatimonadaceae bacterium]
MQGRVALFRDAVSDYALELRRKREHGAEYLANGSEIIIGDPTAEAEELLVEDRGGIDDAEDIFGGDIWL